MRNRALAGLALLLSAGALHAGVYNTVEPPLYPLPSNFTLFQSRLGDLRSIPVQRPSDGKSPRDGCLQRVAALEEKGRVGTLTVADRINLGADYIRLLKYEEAVRLLDVAQAEEPDNFMVLANLATANELAGRADRAIFYEQQALKAWPRVWLGYSTEQLNWYRRAERYYLHLLELRQQESRQQFGRKADESLDALFPGMRFVGPSGQYEAGEMNADSWDALPLERIPLLSQLVLWLPFDNRLYWLLGELLNAQGDVEAAYKVLDDLVYARGFRSPELFAHRQVLLKAKPAAELFNGTGGPLAKEQLLWALAPRGATPSAGIGSAVSEAGWAVAVDSIAQPPAPPTPLPQQPAMWLPDWRTFTVGMASGAALALLVGMQLRYGRRRTV